MSDMENRHEAELEELTVQLAKQKELQSKAVMEAQGATLAVRKELRNHIKSTQEQGAREAEARAQLKAAQAQIRKLDEKNQDLTKELGAKAMRLGEWEHMASKQKKAT
ncbi:unnamed protein product, partial [Chrysoparadoxa australica]